MRRYLVTGGFGFLGAALVKALVSAGHQVRVLDNSFRGSKTGLEEIGERVECVETDIRDGEAVYRAISGVDSVCHLAFINGTRYFYEKPRLVLEVGVKGMLNVMDGCIRAGVRELILASSSEVYQRPSLVPTDESVPLSIPDPHNPRYSYAGGKIISELLALHYGDGHFERVVIFRPHNVYGPRMGGEHVIPEFIRRLAALRADSAEGQVMPFEIQGDGTQTRAFIYIHDFIDGLMCVIDRGKHRNIYHIGSDEEVTIRELAEKIARLVGVKIRLVPGPEASGATPRRCPDIRKLQGLGFRPATPLDQGLRLTVEWYLSQLRVKQAALL